MENNNVLDKMECLINNWNFNEFIKLLPQLTNAHTDNKIVDHLDILFNKTHKDDSVLCAILNKYLYEYNDHASLERLISILKNLLEFLTLPSDFVIRLSFKEEYRYLFNYILKNKKIANLKLNMDINDWIDATHYQDYNTIKSISEFLFEHLDVNYKNLEKMLWYNFNRITDKINDFSYLYTKFIQDCYNQNITPANDLIYHVYEYYPATELFINQFLMNGYKITDNDVMHVLTSNCPEYSQNVIKYLFKMSGIIPNKEHLNACNHQITCIDKIKGKYIVNKYKDSHVEALLDSAYNLTQDDFKLLTRDCVEIKNAYIEKFNIDINEEIKYICENTYFYPHYHLFDTPEYEVKRIIAYEEDKPIIKIKKVITYNVIKPDDKWLEIAVSHNRCGALINFLLKVGCRVTPKCKELCLEKGKYKKLLIC